MKRIIFLLLLIPVFGYSQIEFEIVKLPGDTTFSVKKILPVDADADTLKTYNEAFAISYSQVHQAAHRVGQEYAAYIQAEKDFNALRNAHDAVFTDSIYYDASRVAIGPELVQDTVIIREGGIVTGKAFIRILGSNAVQLKEYSPGIRQGTFQVGAYNYLKLLPAFFGETVEYARDPDRDIWRGELGSGTNLVLRPKKK